MRKKITGLILAVLLVSVLGMLAGCGKKDEKKETKEKEAKGRYVEETVSLPVKEGEEGVSLIRKKDGGFRVYIYHLSEKTYSAYDSEDGKEFREGDAGWLNQITGGKDHYQKHIFEGEDGKEYLLYYTGNKTHLMRHTQGTESEEVLPEIMEASMGVDIVAVTKSGDVVVSDTMKGEIRLYSAADGTCLKSMEQGTSATTGLKMFDYKNGRAVTLKKDGRGFAFCDVEKEEVIQEIEYKNVGDSYGVLKLGAESGAFLLDRNGLHHINENGTAVETILDGDMASMGDMSVRIDGFEVGDNQDYYALYTQEGIGVSFAHYVYDKNAKASADKQFTIYGLSENNTIKQAAARFQKAHPEIRVSYKTGTQDETGTTRADQIRVLNTELLSGNGADILVLDGLPIQSYVDKGVLEDMTDFYENLSKKEPLGTNIMESMKIDGKIYGMPVRVKVLGIYGGEEEVKAMESLDSLKAYLDKNKESRMIPQKSYEQYLDLLMRINYKELFGDSGKKEIEKEELEKLLETTKQLGETLEASHGTTLEFYMARMGEESEEAVNDVLGESILSDISTNNDIEARNSNQAVIVEGAGSYDLMITCAVLKELGMTPQSIHDLYLPKGIVGVNSGSKNKELTEEFLELLFAEEIQTLDLGTGEGFPVNEKALENWCAKEVPEGGGMSIGTSDENGNQFGASEPNGDDLKPFVELERKADTPIIIDEVVLEVIKDESIAYFKGEISLEKAVQNITNKVKTYLAE